MIHAFSTAWRRVVTALALAMALAGAPATAASPAAPEPAAALVEGGIYEYRLPSGQTLYVKPDRNQPIVTIDTWVRTGSVNESQENNGVSHFLEHLLFKGTQQHPPGAIERLLESKGSEFNAATSDDYTHYYITTATPYFEEALGLHADMLLNANFPPAELSRERAVVQEEINRAMDNPVRQLFVSINKHLYPNHGYAMDTLGPKENIANIPRERILDYYHYWYQPENFSTVVVGDVDPEQVKTLVSRQFSKTPFAQPKGYAPPAVGKPWPLATSKSEVRQDPKISQAYVSLNFQGPAIDKAHDTYALDIAMNALGSGKSSRLYRRLVLDKTLATQVSASNATQKYAGTLNIYVQCKPDNLDEVKRIVLEELTNLKATGITQAELDKAKTQYLKDFIFLNETTDGVAQSIGYNVTIGTLKDYTDYVGEIQKITLEDVSQALKTYLDFDRALVIELLPGNLTVDADAVNTENLARLKQAGERSEALIASKRSKARTAASGEASQAADGVEKITLDNGLTVLLKRNPNAETLALKLFVKGGQMNEAAPGVASLSAQLLLQGTASRSAEQINHELDAKGMSLTASASEDYVEISGNALGEDAGELFLILTDVLNHARYDETELVKQKELLRQSIAASRDNPSSLAFENLTLAMYPDHPYGNVGRRVEESLDAITRNDVMRFVRHNLTPENTLAVVVGNFKPEVMRQYLAGLYGPASITAPTVAADTGSASKPEAPAPIAKNTLVEVRKDRQAATWVAQGWLAPAINPTDHVALKVLNSLLGTGMSSRLFVDLREKQGLAYVVSSFYPSRRYDSRFVMYIGTDPKNFKQVEAGFQREIERLKKEPVGPRELQDAKDKLAGSFALAHETNASQAYYLGLFETLGVGYAFDAHYPELVQRVTAADIQRVAQTYFSKPNVMSVVRPPDSAKVTQRKKDGKR